MKNARTRHLTHRRLLELLRYDPTTGHFFWLGTTSNRVPAGRRAGSISKHCDTHYRKIRVDDVLHFEHRLAWFYMTKRWPKMRLDHRDLDGTNNAWENLREATPSQNMCNRRADSRNKSGVKGVYQRSDTGKWDARIQLNGAVTHLGSFANKDDAARAYAEASKRIHGEFGRSS